MPGVEVPTVSVPFQVAMICIVPSGVTGAVAAPLLQAAPAPVVVLQVRLPTEGVWPGLPVLTLQLMACPISVIVCMWKFVIVVQEDGITP